MGTLAVALRFCVLILATPVPSATASLPEKDTPYPTLVTAATRADAEALAELEKPGEVFFREDFEAKNALDKYFDVSGRKQAKAASKKEGFAFVTRDRALAHGGVGALRCTTIDMQGQASSADVNYWFGQPRRVDNKEVDPGYERVHLRCYIKWDKSYDGGRFDHAGVTLAAVAGDNKWEGMKGGGTRPKGDDYCFTRFEASVEGNRHPTPGALYSYTTWMDMKSGAQGKYWGNALWPEDNERFLPEPGEWYCIEQMIKLNSFKDDLPQNDGELATWIDGKLYTHFTGIRWRSSPAVRLKRCSLSVYMYKSEKENTVWFDDLALSTGYIGPIKDENAKAKDPKPTPPALSADPQGQAPAERGTSGK